MSAGDFFDVVGRPSFPFFVQGRDLWKKSNFRCFSKTRNLSKIQDFLAKWVHEIFSPSPIVVFVVVGRRLRRSSPTSVVAVGPPSSIISLFRPREGPLKKIKFSMFFKNSQSFWNSRFLAKWVHEIFSPSSVVRHFPFSSKGGTFEKNQVFAVFQKLAIFLKFKIFGKMSARVVGRPRHFSSVVGHPSSSVVHFSLSKGGTFEKNQIFAVFQKLAIFLKFKIFGKMSARDFFAVADRRFRRRRSSSSSVVADVGRRRRHRSSIISLFRPREGPLKKIKFSMFFKNSQSF